MYYVYLLKSKKNNNEIYIGSTNNLKRRFSEHNLGKEISTARYKPWKLLYYEAYQSEKDARNREMRLKNHGNSIKQLKKRIKESLKTEVGLPRTIFFPKKKGAGFTLIELIVVISIFIIIVIVTAGVFVSIVQQQRRTLAEQELLNQTSYVMEYMSRALRMAIKDTTGACLGPERAGYNYVITRSGNGIKFINHSNNDICQEFYFYREPYLMYLGKIKESKDGGITSFPLVSDFLEVNYFNIELYGDSEDDGLQPRIVISMEIQVKGTGEQPKKQIQTTISQRNLDID